MIWVIIIIIIIAVVVIYPEISFERTDPGVIINGVEWATCNVAAKGFFTKSPEDKGKSFETFETYEACPSGWRLPNEEEIESLFDRDKVRYEPYYRNGEIKGIYIVDISTGNSMIIPITGTELRGNFSNDIIHVVENGAYYHYRCLFIIRMDLHKVSEYTAVMRLTGNGSKVLGHYTAAIRPVRKIKY